MFRSASLFIGTSFTVPVFTVFATSNVDSIVGIPHKKMFNAKNFNPHKNPISLLNVPIWTQGMQRTWWPEAGTIIVTGLYCLTAPGHYQQQCWLISEEYIRLFYIRAAGGRARSARRPAVQNVFVIAHGHGVGHASPLRLRGSDFTKPGWIWPQE